MSSSDTTMSIIGGLWPSSGNFTIRVGFEIILVTAITSVGSGWTFTVTRAQEGTTAGTYTGGTIVSEVLTASSLARLAVQSKNGTQVSTRREINFIEGTDITLTVSDNSGSDRCDVTINSTGGGGGGGSLTTEHNGTSVSTETTLNLIDGNGIALTVADNGGAGRCDITVNALSLEESWIAPPAVSTLTWINQSTGTATDDDKGFFVKGTSGGSNQWATIGIAPPSGVAWTFTARLEPLYINSLAGAAAGIFLCQGSSSSPGIRFAVSTNNIYVVKDNNIEGSFNGAYVNTITDYVVSPFKWFRIQNDLTNLTWSASTDGKYWYKIAIEGVTDFLTGIATVAVFVQFGASGFDNGLRVLSWEFT